MCNVMTARRTADRVSLPLIVVFVLTLLAFLPLALPGNATATHPVQGYSGAHRTHSAVPDSSGVFAR